MGFVGLGPHGIDWTDPEGPQPFHVGCDICAAIMRGDAAGHHRVDQSVQGQAEAGPALFRWHLWAAGQEVKRLRTENRRLREALDVIAASDERDDWRTSFASEALGVD